MKRIQLLDVVLLLVLAVVAAALVVRTYRPDAVSSALTDLSRREAVTVFVAVPNPWRQQPLADLPRRGDRFVGEGGRDVASFAAMTGETGYPVAVIHVRARIDAEKRLWFHYGEILPGANFSFRTDRYTMDGLVLRVLPGFVEDASAGAERPRADGAHAPDTPAGG